MKRMLFAALAVATIGFATVFAQSGKSPLEGAWVVQNVTYAKPPANPVNKPIGFVIFSGNHYSITHLENSVRPNLSFADIDKATADQLRAVWGPIIANAGTFQVSGNKLTTRPAIAKTPEAMAAGRTLEETFTLKGDTLTLTLLTGPTGTPTPNPRTLHLVRAK